MIGQTAGRRPVLSVDALERLSRAGTLVAFLVAAIACGLAPLWAISWANRPFLGFFVEPTLIVTGTQGEAWTGREAGIAPREQLLRVGGSPVDSAQAYQEVLATLRFGETVPVMVVAEDGTSRLFPAVATMAFPRGDLVRLFGVPYLIGLAYLVIGAWVYLVRGQTRPGRVLAFFCFAASVTCVLIFDIWTTHIATGLWAAAVALSGGAILSMAMRFPVEWGPVHRRPWLLAVPYLISIALGLRGLGNLHNMDRPFAYVRDWQANYLYVAIAILSFLSITLHRARRAESSAARQQARIVLVGSAFAFIPVMFWLISPWLGLSLVFRPLVYLPPMLLFPISIWVAILRYRLLDVDDLVSRTVLYGALTAVLAGIYTISITISQRVFVSATGSKSDAAIVLTTLVVASLMTPLRARLQALLDRRLKTVGERGAELRHFAAQVRLFSQLSRPDWIACRFLDEAVEGLRAESGALSAERDGRWRVVETRGAWTGDVWLQVPLACGSECYAVVALGAPLGRRRYTEQERDTLGAVADEIGRAIRDLSAQPAASMGVASMAIEDAGRKVRALAPGD